MESLGWILKFTVATASIGSTLVLTLLKIRVADMQHYQRFLGGKLATIEGISQTHTYVVIENVKSQTEISITV